MRGISCLVILTLVMACDDDSENESPDATNTVDGAVPIDAAPPPDADPTAPDADPVRPDANEPPPDANEPLPDAPPPAIEVRDCDGLDIDEQLTTSGFTFTPNTLTITAGETIRFTTTGRHNFASPPGAPADKTWDTGTAVAGGQTKCVTFRVAGTYPFVCTPHINRDMLGTLTVEP
jgi:plastocyanin